MIHIQCEHCGTRLKMLDERAGKSGRCPKCGGIIPVPIAAATTAKTLDPQLLDLPKPPAIDDRSLDERMRELKAAGKASFTRVPENAGGRRFAWPIDILLYPANAGGIGALVIIAVIPAVLTFLMHAGGPLAGVVGLPFMIISLLVGLYAIRYVAECVCDSAEGRTRAPAALDIDVSLTELRSQILDIVVACILFIGPAWFYETRMQRHDAIFWGLVAWAVAFFPMGLLAMVIRDSWSVLNPLFLLGAISRTLRPYLGVLLLAGSVAGLYWFISARTTAESSAGWFLRVVGELATAYLGLVAAHVLGRFYRRYHDRLNWEPERRYES